MAQEWLVVGLGNPGPKYRATRHNVGHLVVEELASRSGATFTRSKAQADVCTTRLGTAPGGLPGRGAVLVRPTTYMNLSGKPVGQLAHYYGIPVERIVAIHDDVDLPFDTVKLKRGGGEGGHNGLRDITRTVGKDYLRVRAGVGRPPGRMDTADFVLRPFTTTERETLPIFVSDLADAVEALANTSLEDAQQTFHSRQ